MLLCISSDVWLAFTCLSGCQYVYVYVYCVSIYMSVILKFYVLILHNYTILHHTTLMYYTTILVLIIITTTLDN